MKSSISVIGVSLSLLGCGFSLLSLMAAIFGGAFGGSIMDEAMKHRVHFMFYLGLIQFGLSIVGLIGTIILKKKTRLSGYLMVVSAIGVLSSSFSYELIPWLLVPEFPLLIIGLILLSKSRFLKEKRYEADNVRFCICLAILVFIPLIMHRSL
ncbi:DUF4064 domain-containing protein [Priestia aryabhattai]|uniref:DUF4064 domain-containing protein n=1 Tax=Priestia aryabhattai TaxID=412384 RepID=UPI002E1C9E64